MIRINEDDDTIEFDGDVRLVNGTPLTGIAFAEYDNSTLKREIPFYEGFPHGTCKEWHSNGQLMKQWECQNGMIIGQAFEWFDDGKIKSRSNFDLGIELEYSEWNRGGELVDERKIDTGSEMYRYYRNRKQLLG